MRTSPGGAVEDNYLKAQVLVGEIRGKNGEGSQPQGLAPLLFFACREPVERVPARESG